MTNSFSKDILTAWEDICEGFEDGLVLSKKVSNYNMSALTAERSNDTIWLPQPYIATSFDGQDATSNYQGLTQRSVPATIGIQKHVPWKLTANQARDPNQLAKFTKAAKQRLSSDVNMAVMNVAATQGSLVVKRTVAATGYDDIAECDSLMNEQGIAMEDRCIALSSRDYNKMAGDLAKRQTLNSRTETAYDRAFVGDIAGFDTFKLDYANNLILAGASSVTINGANQYYTPVSTTTDAAGNKVNVDNRYQTITIAVGSGAVKVGDAFTIAGVNAVHHITKEDTGQLKTFRVAEIVTGAGGSGTIKISPALVSGGGATDAELQYQNVTATPANGAAITFLNTATKKVNPFWHGDSIEFIPSSVNPDTDGSAEKVTHTTENGMTITMTKQFGIDQLDTKYRVDIQFGVVNKNPEMNGIMLFDQV